MGKCTYQTEDLSGPAWKLPAVPCLTWTQVTLLCFFLGGEGEFELFGSGAFLLHQLAFSIVLAAQLRLIGNYILLASFTLSSA